MGLLTTDDAIKAHLDGKKTPYQLDLEVKDRKPDIVPKVGDRVKIKSLEWYEKWKDEDEDVNFRSRPNFFSQRMKKYCGRIVCIKDVFSVGFGICEDDGTFVWLPEFFEEVYPVQEQLSSKLPRIDLSSTLPLEGTFQAKEGELIVRKMDFLSMIEETAKRLSAYTLVKGLEAKPKLKQVKTTHLIKLKKL